MIMETEVPAVMAAFRDFDVELDRLIRERAEFEEALGKREGTRTK
jgi:hypothetical protein